MKSKGFTLIELAIVIVIIGILAAVAIPRFTDMTAEARKAQRQSIATSLKSAYAIYLAKNSGSAPSWNTLKDYLQDLPNNLKFSAPDVYMDYNSNNTADTGEGVVKLYSDDTCATGVTAATTAIKCIANNIN